MRRLMTVPLAGLFALTMAVPALAGPNVGNFSGSVTIAQANWDTWDEATGSYGSGFIAVSQEQGASEAFAEYSEYSEVYIQCTGAETPDDPDDDTYGIVGSYAYGWGSAVLTTGKNSGTASASGEMSIGRESFNECTGDSTFEELPGFSFGLDLTATSGTVRESGRGSFHVPSEFNSHNSYKAVYRFADGTFDGPDGPQDVSGMIGTLSWKDHSNG
jgi:hypothetical protein